MKEFFANPPMWYWILVAVFVFISAILSAISHFCYVHDVYVNGEWFRACQYMYHPFTKDIEIWNSKNDVYIRTRCTEFVKKRSYWKWNAPEEDEDE